MTEAGCSIKVEVIIGIIRTFEVGTIFEITGIKINIKEVIIENKQIETGYMMEVEAGIEMIRED